MAVPIHPVKIQLRNLFISKQFVFLFVMLILSSGDYYNNYYYYSLKYSSNST